MLFLLCFECSDPVFQIMPIFDKDYMNMGFHGSQIEYIVAILLLKCSIGIPNGTKYGMFLENFVYDQ